MAEYEVDEARDGQMAISLLRTKAYDAVVSDYAERREWPGRVNVLARDPP
jgi:hypothetical protein